MRIFLFVRLALLASFIVGNVIAQSPRERLSFDENWRFALGHATDPAKDFDHGTGYFSYLAKTGYGDGPAAEDFDDRGWRRIDVPHDWAPSLPFHADASHSHGYKAIGPGFPENSVGWYRRHFHIPESDLGRRISIEFEGIYRNAAVFVNGFFLGQEPSGYIEQSYDITEYLNYGGNNVIAVRADASFEEGWYYEGAGIYRHVWLHKTNPVRVQRHGTFVTSSIHEDHATIDVATKLENVGRTSARIRIRQQILDPVGTVAAEHTSTPITLLPGQVFEMADALAVREPSLWDLDNPHLHTLITSLIDESGNTVDRYETTFGIREIRFDPDEGFFLNGRHVKLKGTNNHQDHAGVGTAIPDALHEFRIRKLKDMGANAYRSAHHPASPALLEICDRLGVLVIEENRMMGINDYHLDQLESLIVSRRNHPSIILWSLGNEEWAIEGNIQGARITTLMQDFARRLDPTRLSTVAISGGWGGISTVVDVMGVNYIRHGDTDQQHRDFPQQIILGTEETTTQATRGIYIEDASKAHLAPLEDGSSGGNAESGWQHFAERDYLAGIFYWTGFDYRGEATPYGFPAVLSQFGILDTCGFPKDSFHYLKAWWTDEPVLHIFPHWNWHGREGEEIEVRAHSNAEEVELFLNGRSLGRQTMPANGHLAWRAPYEPGTLEALGFIDGERSQAVEVRTTGAPARVKLSTDRSRIQADGRDVSVVTVRVADADGLTVPTAHNGIRFDIDGPGKIIGVGNGNPSSHEPDQYLPRIELIELGNWSGADLAEDSTVVFEANFDRPDRTESGHVRLLLNAFGPEQTATLNGERLPLDDQPDGLEIPLQDLRSTGNVLRMQARAWPQVYQREATANVKPATLRIDHAAAPYERAAFNGLAQVIVQSTGSTGEIVLTAESDGLEGRRIIIVAE